MPDFVIVYICRENITRSEVLGLPKPSLRSAWPTSPEPSTFAGTISIGVMPLPSSRAATPSGVSPSIRPLDQLAAARASGVAEDRHQVTRSALQRCPGSSESTSVCETASIFGTSRLVVIVEAAGDAHGFGTWSCRWRRGRCALGERGEAFALRARCRRTPCESPRRIASASGRSISMSS